MQVAILAGGKATRLEKLTRNQPKSMIKISGKPFLEYQLEMLRGKGVTDIILCIGYLGERIKSYFGDGRKFGVNIKYSYETSPLGTGGALKNAESLLKDVFFTMYGDAYLFLDFATAMAYFQSQDRLALMTVYRNCNRYGRSNTVVEGNLVRKFSNKEKDEGMVYIEYGVNIFRKKVLEMVPEDKFYSLDTLFPQLIEMNELLAFEVKKRFYEIGSPRGLEDFEEFVKNASSPEAKGNQYSASDRGTRTSGNSYKGER